MTKALPPEFKGLWVSRAIFEASDLGSSEKLIVAEVDYLTTEKGPCKASNAHFAALLGSSTGAIHNLLTEMQKQGKLIQLGFHRLYRERVVKPAYSEHPELVEKWIEKHTEYLKKLEKEKNKSRTHEKVRASSHENMSPSSHENISRGLMKTLVEDSPFHETEVPIENSIETSSSVSRERSSGSGSDNGFHGNDDDENLVTKEGEASASANGENGHVEEEHDTDGFTPGEEQELVTLLTDRGYSPGPAKKLARQYPDRIEDYVALFDHLNEQGKELDPGWLKPAISEPYTFPKGFKPPSQRARERKERQAAAAAKAEKEERMAAIHQEENRLNDLAQAYIDKLIPEELSELEAEAKGGDAPWRNRRFFYDVEKRRIARKRLGLVNKLEVDTVQVARY